MIMIARGILWYGLYLFLVLLPLLAAGLSNPGRVSQPLLVEIAVGAGLIGFSLMSLEFALISRIKSAAAPFGEDSLQLFHNSMGIVALGLITAHFVLLIVAGYPAGCWLNPFSACANLATRTAWVAVILLLLLIGSSIWRKNFRLSYELWLAVHGLFSLLVVLISLVHIFLIGRYTSTPLMKGVWALYAVLVVGLILWFKVYSPLKNWQRPWEIVENRVERGDSRTLVLKPVGHNGWAFEPGQFSWVKTGQTPFRMGQHPISMSSAGDVPPGGQVAFTIKNLGDWSGEKVPALKPGDKAWLDGPHGVFTLDRQQAMGYVLIGGGVGITPLYSMVQTMVEREDVRPVLLFYGASNAEEMTFREELEALAVSEALNMRFVPVLSSPEADWEGERGYVNAEIMKRYLPNQFKRFKYLICGPEALMDAMEEALPELGVPPQSVLSERFDMV